MALKDKLRSRVLLVTHPDLSSYYRLYGVKCATYSHRHPSLKV